MKKILKFLVSIILLISVSGCSLFAPHTQPITITGEPAGALVVVNGQPMTAPATIKVPKNKQVSLTVTKKGYYPFFIHSGYTLSTLGILDVIGGFFILVPFIGLAAPGAWTLDQDHFYYVLTPSTN
ncbi:MAG: hypothetical protein IKA65_06750 [Lentisphaeria bacterium]|nr:hypothetical protein [Lentisphaeria bacterium]